MMTALIKPTLFVVMMFAVISFGVSSPVSARDGAKAVKEARSLPQVRGGIVFKSYCTLCHGEIGDGIARASKLYGPEMLIIGRMDREGYESIVRKGGVGVGRSEYMPPWEGELTEEQISDVVAYLTTLGDGVARGEVVYKTNCVLCHGVNADGKGRVSVLYDPKPSNLIRSDKNTQYKMMIVTEGGELLGRSAVMPPWGLQLSEREIKDVVSYIDTLVISADDLRE